MPGTAVLVRHGPQRSVLQGRFHPCRFTGGEPACSLSLLLWGTGCLCMGRPLRKSVSFPAPYRKGTAGAAVVACRACRPDPDASALISLLAAGRPAENGRGESSVVYQARQLPDSRHPPKPLSVGQCPRHSTSPTIHAWGASRIGSQGGTTMAVVRHLPGMHRRSNATGTSGSVLPDNPRAPS